jgi:uncharacterized protein YjbJ (UPF0337 family)
VRSATPNVAGPGLVAYSKPGSSPSHGTVSRFKAFFRETSQESIRYWKGEQTMDKDRIKGSAQQAKGAVKEAVGKMTGDAKLEAEGKSDKVAGKMQNAIGGFKDRLRGK